MKLYRMRLPVCLLVMLCWPASTLTAQLIQMDPTPEYLRSVLQADRRDSAHLEALGDYSFHLANQQLMNRARQGGRTPIIDSLLAESRVIANELGAEFPVRATINGLRTDARLGPQFPAERRKETYAEYLLLRDSLAARPSPRNDRLRYAAFVAMYWYPGPDFPAPEKIAHAAELRGNPHLSDGERIMLTSMLINLNLQEDATTDRGIQLIDSTLRHLEVTEGAHREKYAIYYYLCYFFAWRTADYDRADEMLLRAAQHGRFLDTVIYSDVLEEITSVRGYFLDQAGNYALAESVLDSAYAREATLLSEVTAENLSYYTPKLRYCRKRSGEECADYARPLETFLHSPAGRRAEEFARYGALAELGLYHYAAGAEDDAFYWLREAHGMLRDLRFVEPDLRLELSKAYVDLLGDRGTPTEVAAIQENIIEVQDYRVDDFRQTAQKRAAFDFNVREYRLERQRAENEALTVTTRAAADRRFYLALLTAALLLILLAGYFYWRSRRDARRIAEQKVLVDQALEEKNILLREIHHRVKNNLQIISSMLNKQARISADPNLTKLVKEGKERIQSMAMVHQNLYESKDLSGVNIRSYLQELSANIDRGYAGKNVAINLDVADAVLDLDTAIPVGLILNELLTNSYKYAFPKDASGRVDIDFAPINGGEQYELRVKDNGIGLLDETKVQGGKTLGANLVRGLVQQLRGTVEWLRPAAGTEVLIRFQPAAA